MAEPNTAKKGMSLPISKGKVVETPKAEANGTDSKATAAAERAAQISAAKPGKAKAEPKPAFVPDQKKLDELYAMTDEDLVAAAVKAGMKKVDAEDYRVFTWTGARTDGLRGQPVDRSKLRSAVVNFLARREGENIGHYKNQPRNHTAQGRVIHAFMTLAGPEVHGGKYDSGYVSTRRGENKSRGMVARGYLKLIGDESPEETGSPVSEQQAAIQAGEPTPQEIGQQEAPNAGGGDNRTDEVKDALEHGHERAAEANAE